MKLELQNLELGQVVWFYNLTDIRSDDKAHARFYSDYIFKLRVKRRGQKCLLVTVLERIECPGLKAAPRGADRADATTHPHYFRRRSKPANFARPNPGEVHTNTRDVFQHGILAENFEDFDEIFQDLHVQKAQDSIDKEVRAHQFAVDRVQQLHRDIAKIQAEIQWHQENRIPECERNIELAKKALELVQNTTVIDRTIADCI